MVESNTNENPANNEEEMMRLSKQMARAAQVGGEVAQAAMSGKPEKPKK